MMQKKSGLVFGNASRNQGTTNVQHSTQQKQDVPHHETGSHNELGNAPDVEVDVETMSKFLSCGRSAK